MGGLPLGSWDVRDGGRLRANDGERAQALDAGKATRRGGGARFLAAVALEILPLAVYARNSVRLPLGLALRRLFLLTEAVQVRDSLLDQLVGPLVNRQFPHRRPKRARCLGYLGIRGRHGMSLCLRRLLSLTKAVQVVAGLLPKLLRFNVRYLQGRGRCICGFGSIDNRLWHQVLLCFHFAFLCSRTWLAGPRDEWRRFAEPRRVLDRLPQQPAASRLSAGGMIDVSGTHAAGRQAPPPDSGAPPNMTIASQQRQRQGSKYPGNRHRVPVRSNAEANYQRIDPSVPRLLGPDLGRNLAVRPAPAGAWRE